MFVKDLEDVNIYVCDAVVLSCSLNQTKSPVIWKKDCITIINNEKMKTISDDEIHWLVIKNAQLNDSGTYMCVCRDACTEAVISVAGNIIL